MIRPLYDYNMKHKISPKSLANLKPPKKGEVRNPDGGWVSSNSVYRAIQRLAKEEIAEIGSYILERNFVALEAIIEEVKNNPDSKRSALQAWMATVAVRGIKTGDPYALDALLNRIVGKVPEELNAKFKVAHAVVILPAKKSLPDIDDDNGAS